MWFCSPVVIIPLMPSQKLRGRPPYPLILWCALARYHELVPLRGSKIRNVAPARPLGVGPALLPFLRGFVVCAQLSPFFPFWVYQIKIRFGFCRPENICPQPKMKLFFSLICVYPSLAYAGQMLVSSKCLSPSHKVDFVPPDGNYPDQKSDLVFADRNIWLVGWCHPCRPENICFQPKVKFFLSLPCVYPSLANTCQNISFLNVSVS